MRNALRKLMLAALESDSAAVLEEGQWMVPCLHCGSKLIFAADGEPLGPATLEHVVPRSWFGKRAAVELTSQVGSENDVRNLALACERCNHAKGYGPDQRGPQDARAREVVQALIDKRRKRLAVQSS